MRTLGFRTHVLLTVAAAAALVFTLDRPWYAPAPPPQPEEPTGIGDLSGPLNALAEGMERWVTSTVGTPGWESLDHWGLAIAVMAGLSFAAALGCLVPGIQSLARDVLRYAALAAFGVVAWKLLDPPGANAAMELRNGALAAAGCALVLVMCAMAVAGAPMRRRPAPRVYEAPPAPQAAPAYGTQGSAPPPGA
jgi:hypothetical protein